MRSIIVIAVVALVPLTTGCESTPEEYTQEVLVNTNPEGAHCSLLREGKPVGEITKTPGTVTVKVTKHDITIRCEKTGFHTATYFNASEVEGAGSGGNVLLGGGVGGGGIGLSLFSAPGADNKLKYTSPVNITLVPLSGPKP